MVRGSFMANDRNRGRRRQDWFGGDGRSGNFAGPRDRDDGQGRRDGPGQYDRRDRQDRRYDCRDDGRDRPQGRDRPAVEQTREVVLPGDLLAHGKNIGGPGTYTENGVVYAAQLGVRTFQEGKVSVLPLGGKYMPIAGDEVIGKVLDVNPNFWLVDINAPYPAPLHIDESAWQVQIGETARYLNQGDIVAVRVQSVDVVKRSKLTMKDGHGMRKLAGGMVMEVSPSKVPRIIGKGGSMISMIKDRTGCMILVGQNGRMWIDGEPDMILVAAEAIGMIDRNAQQSGLTDAVQRFLEERTGSRR
jgi:exosome complex component RRP4